MKINKFCNLEESIKYICDNEYSFFLNKDHVIGVGLGYRIIKGFQSNESCIKVFVDKKIGADSLSCENLIPKEYKGIKTDVVESGICTCVELSKRIRPIPGGYSISPVDIISSGTMGCLVTDGFNRFMLSNNHVLANLNKLPINEPIVQPGMDDKANPSQDVVALLYKYIPLNFGGIFKKEVNYADCAIAKLLDKNYATPDIALLGKLKGISNPKLNQTVAKCGRTTEVTLGKVTSINTTFKVYYGLRSALFKNQIITTYMAEGGDSGSVLLDNKKYVLGLLAGASQICGVFNNIHDVLNLLSIQIITS
ncbi:hypothetical protein [Clostridium botulinum]|uniref:hypothetical protein n=1 Tax=Clostridium botulinum TaxID=1491 RepID=UPI000301224A|nr:hypothetical protein [Clostridium botulinum]KLU74550.1 hypothetical protein CBC3_13515 [Clostridium botulinum V891]MCD3255007.1 serine protease [Clostridium botulinum C/D]MCD3280462.1 serine protease [Clostridium botulinum C/D]MCD3283226.1 serine protease [Clostridium botulinum C/D]MCD3340209.1 serine protease [Clostridium botulinum C/D]